MKIFTMHDLGLLRTFFSIVLCLLTLQFSYAQIKVKGQVADETGFGLPGATVMEKGTSNGSITDLEGNFELSVADDKASLVVSFVGFESKEISLNGSTQVSVVLKETLSELGEVVVVGYGIKKRSEITGAVSVTTSDEINKVPAPRLEQVLQGRTSGVQITQSSGSPGNGLSVRVRGIGTPNNSDPLYVVDGVWFDNVDFLDPGDIESISVLKDAASAAIYGTNGANGVVLITTKSGKKGTKGKVSYDGYYGIQTLQRRYEMMNAQEYAEFMLEANGGNFRESDPRSVLNDPAALGQGTDWQDELFQNAPIQNHRLSMQGGGEKSTYSVMGSYFSQDGIVGGSKSGYDRYTFRLKTDQQINKLLKIGQNLSLTSLTRQGVAENNEFASPIAFAQNIDPVTSPFKEDGTYNFSKLVAGDIKNPLNRLDKFNSEYSSRQLIGNVFGELTPLEGLKLRTSASLDINYARQFDFTESYNLDPSGVFVHEQILINGVTKQRNLYLNKMWENMVSYQRSFGKHRAEVLLGTTYRDRNYENLTVSLGDLPFNSPDSAYIYGLTLSPAADTLGNQDRLGAGEALSESTLFSYFARLDYSFADKYFISATFRRDGSSRFGANNRYAVFPSVSLGWLLSEEKFFSLPSVNYAKLRASWGQNGNEKIDDYGFVGTINNGAGEPGIRYVLGSGQTILQGAAPTLPYNPDRKWEVSTQTNIGLDLAFLNDKIQFSADYFYKKTSDLLIRKEEPAIYGTGVNFINVPFVNAGEIVNQGVELMAILNHSIGELDMDFNLNGTFIRNKVTDLGLISTPVSSGYNQGVGGSITRMEEGRPFGYFYGYQTLGVFQNQFEIEEYVDAEGKMIQPGAKPGDFKFADLDGDGVITSDDRTEIGNPYPDVVLGFSTSLSYKIFDLSAFFQGSFGNDIFNATTRWDLGVQNRPAYRLDRWTEGNPSNTEPRAVIRDSNQNFRVSDYFVEDGSYVKLKNIQLGISLPKDLMNKTFIDKFRVYFNVQNLFTITKYRGLDPEIGKQNGFNNDQAANLDFGIDRGFYPQARTFTTGINITF